MAPPTQSQTQYTQSLLNQANQHTSSTTANVRSTLNLEPHPEGGWFTQTDCDPRLVPNPFISTPIYPNATFRDSSNHSNVDQTPTRHASTTIYYLLDPAQPKGAFHRNKGRTVHTLHWGRGVYVIIHADEADSSHKARIKTFTVGSDIDAGEKLQWIVEGGKFKASFLLPDADSSSSLGDELERGRGESQKGLLISETVVPGFEYMDHDFLTLEGLRALVGEKEVKQLEWLLRKDDNTTGGKES